jgi:hypothetical protein
MAPFKSKAQFGWYWIHNPGVFPLNESNWF